MEPERDEIEGAHTGILSTLVAGALVFIASFAETPCQLLKRRVPCITLWNQCAFKHEILFSPKRFLVTWRWKIASHASRLSIYSSFSIWKRCKKYNYVQSSNEKHLAMPPLKNVCNALGVWPLPLRLKKDWTFTSDMLSCRGLPKQGWRQSPKCKYYKLYWTLQVQLCEKKRCTCRVRSDIAKDKIVPRTAKLEQLEFTACTRNKHPCLAFSSDRTNRRVAGSVRLANSDDVNTLLDLMFVTRADEVFRLGKKQVKQCI